MLPAIDRLQEIPGISRHAAQVIIAEAPDPPGSRVPDLNSDTVITKPAAACSWSRPQGS